MKEKKIAATGIFCTLVGGILWGFSGACGQFLFQNYGVNTRWLTTVRMICAGLVLIALGLIKERNNMIGIWRSRRDAVRLIVFAVMGLMFCQLSYMQAIAYSNAGTATVLQNLGPAIIMISSCFIMKKLPSRSEITAIVLALIGVFILSTHGNIHSMVLTKEGLLWGILAAFGAALYTMLPVNIMEKWGSISVTGYGMFIGGVVLGIGSKAWRGYIPLDGRGIAALIAICFLGTVVAFTLFLQGVKIIGAVKASMLGTIEPLSAALIMVMWLNTELIWIDIIGFFCILMTVFILSRN
ncbi:DMT family transporter [Alloiococcus sp. CFN-8]|uniref:DMT family transporter n=1 Tax=Alloiococcus sp. CFN-8 TaxID=3416081 RepID=UPI003CF11F75